MKIPPHQNLRVLTHILAKPLHRLKHIIPLITKTHMKTPLQTLIDTQLTSVTFIHDYLQLSFSNGSGLTINNTYHWSTTDYVSVIGSRLQEALEEKDRIIFKFSKGDELVVGFNKKDFLSPDGEGMLLYTEGAKTPIIWDEGYPYDGSSTK